MNNVAFIIAVTFAAFIAIYFTLQNPYPQPEPLPITPPMPLPVERPGLPPEPVACTMDAKQCPDGSYVGRVGPHCEFALCP